MIDYILEMAMDHQIHSFIQQPNMYWGTMLGTQGKTGEKADMVPYSLRDELQTHKQVK